MFQAINNRVAVNFDELNLPVTLNEAKAILESRGFKIEKIDLQKLIEKTRALVGQVDFRRGALLTEAPQTFRCSSLTQWFYAQIGILLPRLAVQQREWALGENIEPDNLIAGDLIFKSGVRDLYEKNPDDGVGHVGIMTERKTVLNASKITNQQIYGLIETPLEHFIDETKFRGAKRILKTNQDYYTIIAPPSRELYFSDDIRWTILTKLP